MKQPINVKDLAVPDYLLNRHKLTQAPWNELFSNGVPRSCSFMLTADPGAGKTTFMLDFAQLMANISGKALYITTEQSIYDIKMMCERIGVNNIDLLESSKIEDVLENIPKYRTVIVDSFACLDPDKDGKAKDKEKLKDILDAIHKNECIFVMIQHITKGGTYRGSTFLAHMVDAVMHMEITDPINRLFTMNKNRFGCCNEYEMQMTAKGLRCGPGEQVDFTKPNLVLAASSAPKGVPNGSTKVSEHVYKSRAGSFYLVTKYGVKYVHQDRMAKLMDKHLTTENVVANYRTRRTS